MEGVERQENREGHALFSALTERFTRLGGVDLVTRAQVTKPRAAVFGEEAARRPERD